MHRTTACRGMTAEKFFTDLRVDKSYCSVDSIDIHSGITSVDFDPRTESALCRSGQKCYILADSTKFYIKPYINKVIDIKEVSCLISDASLDPSYIKQLKNLGIQVITPS